MKFKYIGQAGFKDLDLVIEGVMNPDDVLIPDTVFEVPDDKTSLIKRIKINGNYEIVHEKPKIIKKKKGGNK